MDDDVLIGPAMPDLFARVPPSSLGATVEVHKPQNWHAMHWRNACELYGVQSVRRQAVEAFQFGDDAAVTRGAWRPVEPRLARRRAAAAVPRAVRSALPQRADAARGRPLVDVGMAFNYVGSELRRALVVSGDGSPLHAEPRRAALRDACALHLTRKTCPSSTRSIGSRGACCARRNADVLQCGGNAGWPPSSSAVDERKKALLARLPRPLPEGKYEIGQVLCQGEKAPCRLQDWVS